MTAAGITRIVIAGGGTAGWMAAAALSRFLGNRAAITLVESEAIGTVGVGEATIPQLALFNASLGIDERSFLAATKATIKLGIEFDGWRVPGRRYMHAFGVVGRGSGLAAFRDFWLRARAEGLADAPYGDYSLNEVAAFAGKMGRPHFDKNARPGPLPELTVAYHFDAALYAAFLRRLSEQSGVTRLEGRITAIDRNSQSGDICALSLDGDRTIEADLFIDCTGFRSLLIGETLGEPFTDWSHQLPCDRALTIPCARTTAFTPYTSSTARAAGWQWRIPLQHRTGNGHVYCSSFMTDDEAATTLLANLDGPPEGDPRPLSFTAGHRTRFWSHNVIALGLAAGFMEPLESTSIHLVQSGIARLLALFPGRGDWAPLSAEFNRQSTFEWQRIRDFLLLHYKANERHGEPFWDAARAIPFTDALAAKVDLFRSSGRITRDQDELFTEEGWAQILIGQGIEPAGWNPLADTVEPTELSDYLRDIRQATARKVAAMPTHDDYLSNYLAA